VNSQSVDDSPDKAYDNSYVHDDGKSGTAASQQSGRKPVFDFNHGAQR
jgi:hypothetical protein